MQSELQPIVRGLALAGAGDEFTGRTSGVDIVAMLTTMGMANAASAASRMLERGVDHVMVVGIAGGVDRTLPIGALISPEVVIDRRSGREYEPTVVGDAPPRGRLSCGDDLVVAEDALQDMLRAGVLAVDMETAAVAEVCDAAGCPWSVYRSISDYAGDDYVDAELFALTNPDGTADRAVIDEYLRAHPEKIEALTQLGRDAHIATEAAAAAAIAALAVLG